MYTYKQQFYAGHTNNVERYRYEVICDAVSELAGLPNISVAADGILGAQGSKAHVVGGADYELDSTGVWRLSAVSADDGVALTFGAGITVSLYSSDGIPFPSPAALISGDPVFKWDVLLMTGETTVAGATNVVALGAHYYRVIGDKAVTVA